MPMAAFQDPAILSLTPKSTPKSDGNSGPGPRYHHAQPNTAEKRDPVILNPADRLTYSSPDETTDSAVPGGLDAHVAQLKLSPINSSKLAFATSDQENLESLPSATLDPGAPGPRKENGKSARGRGRRRNKVGISNGSPAPTGGNKGAGWRQTPMLQSSASFQPFASLKKSQKRRVDANVANVWASEDVTDVQEAGDFDFEGSLAKFDKRKIFDEMKEQDQIDEAERLVSHNRLPRPKPGTAGGKNLHYTENVLDLPQAASRSKVGSGDYWKSEADDEIINGDDRTSVIEGSGRTSRLRGESRVSMSRRSQSRKASTTASVSGSSRVNSAVRACPPCLFLLSLTYANSLFLLRAAYMPCLPTAESSLFLIYRCRRLKMWRTTNSGSLRTSWQKMPVVALRRWQCMRSMTPQSSF